MTKFLLLAALLVATSSFAHNHKGGHMKSDANKNSESNQGGEHHKGAEHQNKQ
jgi:hypothetical protein